MANKEALEFAENYSEFSLSVSPMLAAPVRDLIIDAGLPDPDPQLDEKIAAAEAEIFNVDEEL